MKRWLYYAVAQIARIHDKILTLNDSFASVLDDKQLHFVVFGIFGILLFFLIHPIFKALAKHGHIIFVSWFYVFTLIIVVTFAIEIGQQITQTGTMEFADIVYGVVGFLTVFGIFAIFRMIVLVIARIVRKK